MTRHDHQFVAKVRQYIKRHNILDSNGRYLVALSGGADSVALLLTLLRLSFHVHAAHCNFRLRGSESDRDENFCVDLCRRLNVPLHRVHFDTKAYAALHHVSIEMAARTLRYSYFNTLCGDLSLKGVCVAHHRDDSVETLLLNLVRGTGVHGLRGILPVNGNVFRPLLCVGRSDILAYLDSLGQGYVTDSSNLVPDVMRNKIRLEVIPLLQRINPDVKNAIARCSVNVMEACRIIDGSVGEAISRIGNGNGSGNGNGEGCHVFSVPRLLEETSPECVLFELLGRYGFSPDQIADVYDAVAFRETDRARLWDSDGWTLLLSRDQLVVEKRQSSSFKPMRLPETGTYVVGDGLGKIRLREYARTAGFAVSKDPCHVCVDAEKIKYPLTVRLCEPGDRFVPFGMKGNKLVSDYLTDRKKNLFEKRRQLVVVSADGTIVWLVNERVDDRFRVTESTERVLDITFGDV